MKKGPVFLLTMYNNRTEHKGTLKYSNSAVTLRATLSTTVSWSPMYAPENCVLLTLERSLSTGPAAVSVTGRSLLLRLEYGTVCRLT